MILIPSVSAERAAGVTSCTGRRAQRNESHSPPRHGSVKVAPSLTALQLSASFQRKPAEWFGPTTMGGPPSVITGKLNGKSTQFACWRPACWQKKMLQKTPSAASKAEETTSVPRRHELPQGSSLSCRKRELTKVSNRSMAEAIRKRPCDEMHSEHHQKLFEALALHPHLASKKEVRHAKKWGFLEGP